MHWAAPGLVWEADRLWYGKQRAIGQLESGIVCQISNSFEEQLLLAFH